jgi:hypothetical protein
VLWWKGKYVNVLVGEQLIATKGTYARGVTIGLDSAPSLIVRLDMHHKVHGSLGVVTIISLRNLFARFGTIVLKGV